jgi:hypothetical protein
MDQIEAKIGRELGFMKSGGRWVTDYFNYNLKGRPELVGDTRADACQKLLNFLESNPNLGDTEPEG